jgi:hypothetical protein
MNHFYLKWRCARLFGIFLGLLLLFQGVVQAQTRPAIVITGEVKDEKGKVIPGVTVRVNNTQAYAVTNSNGAYSIKVPSKQNILVFSYLGFISRQQIVGNQTTINVILKEDPNLLDEVLVVGYGTQKRSEVTGSISSIKEDQIEFFAGGSLNTSLQGKIAGLQITTESGEPGSAAKFNLRGVSSINGDNSPLIIIDGIPVNNSSFSSEEDEAKFRAFVPS